MSHRYVSNLLLFMMTTCASSSALAAEEPPNKRWLVDAKGCKFVDPSPAAVAAAPIRFSGTCVEGLVHGEGAVTVQRQPSVEYRGMFEKGSLRKGTALRADGLQLTGDFKDNQLHGAGTMRFPSGKVVVGTFAKGAAIGAMDVTMEDGGTYHGQIDAQNYWPQGRGRAQWADGQAYEGEFLRGMRHGKGKATYPNGDVYIGEFANDHHTGQGVIQGADGYRYEGQWLNDAAHGSGTQKLVDGEVYVGEFLGGHRHGQGRADRTDGTFRKGEWKGDLLNGKCEMVELVDGGMGKYSGDCQSGHRQGTGRAEWPGGAYEGGYRAGKAHGRGKETREGTDVQDKEEYEGDFLQGVRHGSGVLRAQSSDGKQLTYEGAFEHGNIAGRGVMTIEGFTMTGEFKEAVLYKGTLVDPNGLKFEIDLEKGEVLQVFPDGTKKLITEEDLPQITA